MPLPGDQHRDSLATTNPFVDTRQVSEYTAQEIATLQSRLEKQLGPEYISTRPGNGGGKVHYLAAEKVINLANEVFGFNGWSSAIMSVQIDFVDENPENGKINLGLSTVVRVTLRDGTYHEDTGYGHCENTKGKAAAFEKARKEAATDGMKRALRNFGNVLGNCLYDKDYLQKITKVKVAPSKWDVENLHRHPDYAPIKKEAIPSNVPRPAQGTAIQRHTSARSAQSTGSFGSAEFEDDFGGNLFDDPAFTNPDEVRLDDTRSNGIASPAQHALAQQNGARHGVPRTNSMPQMRPQNVQHLPPPQNMSPLQNVPPQQRPQAMQRPSVAQPPTRMLPPQTPANMQRPQPPIHGAPQQHAEGVRSNPSSASAGDSSTDQDQQTVAAKGVDAEVYRPPPPRDVPQGVPEGFVTGRKADLLNQPADARPPVSALSFNPHAESPSIRRTQGINPGKSAPVMRQQINGANNHPVPHAAGGMQGAAGGGFGPASRPQGPNFVNPASDMNRKVGMPQNAGGRLQNGAPYRPPTAAKRPAMTDVTNTHQMDGASDPKKAKIESAPVQGGTLATTDSTVAT